MINNSGVYRITNTDAITTPQYIILQKGIQYPDRVEYGNPIGFFSIPTVTPELDKTNSYSRNFPKPGTSNILNKNNNLGTMTYSESNYVQLTIPQHLFTINSIKVSPHLTYGEYDVKGCNDIPVSSIVFNPFKKGQKFIAIAINGDWDFHIIGVVV